MILFSLSSGTADQFQKLTSILLAIWIFEALDVYFVNPEQK